MKLLKKEMQKYIKKVFFVALLFPLMLSSQPKIIDAVVGVVGQNIITKSELDFEIAQIEAQYGAVSKEDRCEIVKNQFINKLMLNQSMLDSIVVTDEEVEAELDNKLRYFERQVGSEAKLVAYLGKSILEYKNEIRPKIREQKLIKTYQQKNFGELKISHREVKSYFDSIPKDSLPKIEAEFEVGQIVMQPNYSSGAKIFAYEKMKSLRARLMKGESFAILAGAYSDDPGSAADGGKLPEFGRGQMQPEFESAAFRLKNDSISSIFETVYGYHIIQLINRLGDRIIARHILIRPLVTEIDQKKVLVALDSVYKNLNKGKINFCEAVGNYSNVDYFKNNCGMMQDQYSGLFKVSLPSLDPETAKKISRMKPGEYSLPEMFYMEDGSIAYRILFLKSETKAHIANLNQDYARVQMAALEAKKNDEIIKWVEKTRLKTYIRVDSNYKECDFANWIKFTEE